MIRYFLLIGLIQTSLAHADMSLVTCPQWKSAHQAYVTHPKRTEALRAKPTKEFLALYRSLASQLGSGRISVELNTALEESGFGDLFDKLMSLHVRGGFPPDFIDALQRFGREFKTDTEPFVIDVSTQLMLEKFRKSYCK